jgi:hypothetical protein
MRKEVMAMVWGLSGMAAALAGPPDLSSLDREAQRTLLHELVRANVAGVNCPGFESSPSEWKFVVATADALSALMGLSVDTYDSKFYTPAFEALDADPDFCAQEGPKIGPLIDRMVEMGGVVDKYKFRG